MNIEETTAEYRAGLKDDRKTYKEFMKQGGKKAFDNYKAGQTDDREEYKRRMKYGK